MYSKDGSLNGPYTWYTPGGKGGGFKATFANGAIVGTVTVLDDKGRVLRTANYPRPWGDVCKAWSMLYPGEVRPATYVEPTKATAPYAAGKVEPECLEDALKVTKLYRYLSGLKWQHLTLTADGNVKAQHGAVLLEKIGNLTHTPGQPADMPADFFKVAYAGCNQSNIYSGLPNLVSSVRGYMDDSDANNIQKVGHRRWVLAPGLQKVGFGISGRYSAMHVIGNVGPAPAFDFVTFPGDGYYPRQLVEKDYAWSAHLAFSKTKVPEKGDLKIKIIRLDDHFQAGDETAGEVVSVLSDAGQGWNVIVFKPNMPKLELGKYWVEIQGIKSNRAGDVPFGYIVDFADMTSVPRQASPKRHDPAGQVRQRRQMSHGVSVWVPRMS